ncbi:MAG TPA: hypothetical protein VHD56_19595 [Tepidisphaeraceae bacterium]|nr:hypothetical protein [Tepidisphaeraceae bacterium]
MKLLSDHKIDFVVIGGVAAALHGSPMATLDIDVCIGFSDAMVSTLISALRPIHPRLRHRPDKMPLPEDPSRLTGLKNLYLDTDLGKIDLLGELPGVCSFHELHDKTVMMDVGSGLMCRVLDIDTLIAAKRKAGRDKDKLAIRYLEAIKNRPQ